MTYESIIMLVVLIAVFYFLLIGPRTSGRRRPRRCVTA